MNWHYLTAGVAFLTFLIHTFIGGRYAAKPLLETSYLSQASKWLNYYCWHIATILLVFITIGFMVEGAMPSDKRLSIFLSTLSFALCGLSIYVTKKGEIFPLKFPSTTLFAIISILGVLSIFLPNPVSQ